MEENNQNTTIRLQKKIEQAIRKTGFDDANFIHALIFHFKVLLAREENFSPADYCYFMLSKHFLDNLDSYPTTGGRYISQINENSGWPVTLLPTELFGENRLPVDYRKSKFYFCLKIGNFLHCRVASIHPTEYQLRVIHKYGATRMLDDLNITVVMRRTQAVLLVLEKDLLLSELIRVAVSSIEKLSEGEAKVYVTVDTKSMDIKPSESLGRISEENLPSYVLNPPEFTSDTTYSDYLNSSTAFRNPLSLDKIFEGFGIDPRGIYTFYPVDECLKPADGKELIKEAKLNVVKSYTNAVQQEVDKGNFQNAVNLIEKSIQSYPMEDITKSEKIELSKLYELKGNYHSELEKSCNQDHIKNWRLAKKTDPQHQRCKRHFCNLAFAAAVKCYRNKDYEEAANLAKRALKIDNTFFQSLTLLEYLRGKHPEAFNELEDESLSILQKKRQELFNELIKQGVSITTSTDNY